ncbi:MAG: right-handed parallel beta-helix repeat-containing protein [Planctomycetes bacterium]|nr:right-handed parallel beta-helix repeat-containing protein [Planctomycetota bacterium]
MTFVERFVTASAGGGGNGSAGSPWTLAEAASSAVAGDRVNIIAATYTLSAAFSPASDGSRFAPIVWRGYTTTPGDASSPVVTLDINGLAQHVIDCLRPYHRFENLTVTGNAGVGGAIFGFSILGDVNVLYRCRATLTNRGVRLPGQGSQLIGCEVDRWTSGGGVQISGDNAAAIGCYVHDGGGFGCGFSAPSSGGYYYCVSAGNVDHGFAAGQSGGTLHRWLVNCVAHGNSGHGVSINGSTEGQPFLLANCLCTDNALFGIGGTNIATGTPHVILLGCGFRGNGSGDVDAAAEVFEPNGRVALAEDPFVDPSAGDFRIRASAASVLGTGYPMELMVEGIVGVSGGSPDLGVLQQRVRPLVNPGFIGAFG